MPPFTADNRFSDEDNVTLMLRLQNLLSEYYRTLQRPLPVAKENTLRRSISCLTIGLFRLRIPPIPPEMPPGWKIRRAKTGNYESIQSARTLSEE
jgi:hypothetical protein